MNTPTGNGCNRTKSSFCEEMIKLPSLRHANSGKSLMQKSSKCDSMSKFMSGDSTMLSSQDGKLLLTKSFKAIVKNTPITVHVNKTGVFQGFAGYSYKNNKKVNEDKLDININFLKGDSNSVNVSLYSIYDGHGGEYVADYLKDNLHKELIRNELLLKNHKVAVLNTYESIEKSLFNTFMNSNSSKTDDDNSNSNSNSNGISISNNTSNSNKRILSGSCALLLTAIDNKISIANLGDSRGIISINNANSIYSLSIDHKPTNDNESQRILTCGGSIHLISNTMRVFPGGLSVSRSFGDFECKVPKLEGKLNVISAIPDIYSFEYKDDMDFILLGCDGIYEHLSNKTIVSIVYSALKKCIIKNLTYNLLLEKVVYKINKAAIRKGTNDNLSCIFLPFAKFKSLFEAKNASAIETIIAQIFSNRLNGERLYEDISDSFVYKYPNQEMILSETSGMNLMNKSILKYQNIGLFEQSFSKSNMSLECKGINDKNYNNNNNNNPVSSDEYETSDEVHKNDNKQHKSNKPQVSCCGLFV